MRHSPFDACSEILGAKAPLDERYNAFFIDYSLVPLLIQQNYIEYSKNGIFKSSFGDDEKMRLLSEASDAMSDLELMGAKVMGADMHWELLPAQAASSLRVGSIVRGFQPYPALVN